MAKQSRVMGQKTRTGLFLIAGVFILSTFMQFALPAISFAAPSDSQAECEAIGGTWKNTAPTGGVPTMGCVGGSLAAQKSLDWQVKSLLYYRAMGKCLKDQNHTSRSVSKIKSGDWFGGGMVAIGPYMKDILPTVENDSIAACDTDLVNKALRHWDIQPVTLLCNAGFTWQSYRGDHERCKSAILDDNDSMVWGDKGSNGFGNGASGMLKALRTYLYADKTPDLTTPGWYMFYQKVFFQQCSTAQKAGQGTTTKPANPTSRDISIYEVSSGGAVEERWYRLDKDMVKKSFTTRIGGEMNFSDVNRTCEEIAKNHLTQSAAAAFKRLQQDDPRVTEPPSTDDTTGNTEEDQPTSCTVEGIGWFICPIATFGAVMTDALYGWIQNFLFVQPLNLDTGSSSNTSYIAWSQMRNLANAAFVIAFIIIIYSQLTGAGVSNYGVKKLLPRLVVSAILVNLSFWVTAIAVDASNVIGKVLYEFLRNGVALGDITISANVWEVVMTSVLSGGAVAGAITAGAAVVSAGTIATLGPVALFAVLTFVLGILLSLIVAFLILAARQALIIILIVVSPIAFVAMLLPNTEKFFTLWRKSLTTLLIFYPLFSLLFGGSYLASMIILGSAGQGDANAAQGFTIILGLAVMAMPLALTPLLIRFSTGILGQVAGMVNNKSKGLIDRSRNARNRKASLAMHETLGSSKASRNPFARAYRRINNSGQRDADRKKVIDSGNKGAYLTSDAGSDMAYRTALGESQVEAASSYNSARFQETLSSSQGVSADHKLKAEIEAARQAHEETNIAKSRVQSAQNVLQREYATELKDSRGMAQRAGGIDPYGASRVTAGAISTVADAQTKAIAAEKITMASTPASDLSTIYRDSNETDERRAAALGQALKVGTDNDIYDALDYVGGAQFSGSAEVKTTMQQQVAADLGARKPIALGQADVTSLTQGSYSGSIDDKFRGRLVKGKLSAEALHTATADDLQRIANVIPTMAPGSPELIRLKDGIGQYKNSPTYRAPAGETAKLIDNIEIRL